VTRPWTIRRHVVSALTVLCGAAAVLGTAPSPADASVTQTASCLDRGGVRWNAKAIWGKTYRGADGVTKATLDYAAWTTTKTGAVPTDARVRTYDGAGHLLQDKTWHGSLDYGGGTMVKAVNPLNPPSAPGKSRVKLTLGVDGDGKAGCTVTLVQPAASSTGTLPPAPPPTAPAPAPAPTSPAPSVSDTYESDVLTATNAERTSRSLVALAQQSCVDGFAEAQAQRMASENRMYHQDLGPVMAGCGLRMVGENVAYGFRDGGAVTAGWMGSPGHRANILEPEYRLIGVGAAQSASGVWYAAQVFGTLR
jgi:uncharacterized protein YkwD